MFKRNSILSATVVLVFSLMLMSASPAAAAKLSKKIAKETKDQFNEELRTLREGNMFLPMSYLEVDGVSYGYYLPRRLVQMVESGEKFRIRKLKINDNVVKVELETDRDARLKILIFDPKKKVSATLLDQVFPMMLADVFEFGTPPQFPRVVVNSRSGLAHLGACNHLPAESLRLAFADDAAAEAAGHKLCPACFPPDPPLPYFNYMPTRMAALESTRLFERAFPPVPDQALQDSIQALGEALIEKLPFGDKGFSYRFRVVESEIMQGQSFPTGFVYLTDKLLAAVEDEGELAHVLAHEIAHCELHLPPNPQIPEPNLMLGESWKSYFQQVRWRETEADLVAISTLSRMYPGKDVAADAISILSKLQFANEAIPLMEGNSYASHPPYGSRLEWLKDGYFPVAATQYFEARDKGGDWVCRVKVLGGGNRDKKTRVIFLLVQMSAGASEEMEVKSNFVDDEFGVAGGGGHQENITFSNDKSFNLEPSSQVRVYPGQMKILTFKIEGIKKMHYGISTPGVPKYHDPTDLNGIELSVPGKVEWHPLPVPGE